MMVRELYITFSASVLFAWISVNFIVAYGKRNFN